MSDETLSPPLVSAGNSDRCPACGAQLAVDQRYCVECGTRRGAPRFSLAAPAGPATAASGPAVTKRTLVPQRVASANTTLLVGLLILLVAMGVGVLIGHNNSPKVSPQKFSVQVNSPAGSGTAAPAAANTGNTGSSASSTASTPKAKKKAAKAAAAAVPSSKNTAPSAKGKAGVTAAAKSFSKSATSKSTLGGSCTAGTQGCQGGKQTGNLF